METQSNIFIPKYLFTAYLKALIFVGFFVYLLFTAIQREKFDWSEILFAFLWGFVSFLNLKNIVKKIEFGHQSMVVHFYVLGEKEIEYQDVEDIVVNSFIKMKGAMIELADISNRMELQKKVAAILLDKKIREINIDERINQQKARFIKILKYAVISTVVIGGVVGLMVHADLATWAFLLFTLFAVIFGIMAIFIKS
jgi:hypothetical protein